MPEFHTFVVNERHEKLEDLGMVEFELPVEPATVRTVLGRRFKVEKRSYGEHTGNVVQAPSRSRHICEFGIFAISGIG